MGYYSEVALVLSKEAVAVMPDKVREALDGLLGKPRLLNFDDKDGSDMVWHNRWMKWREGFEDVKEVKQFLVSLNDEKDEFYDFLRMGEEYGDYEHDCTYDEPWLEMDWGISPPQDVDEDEWRQDG